MHAGQHAAEPPGPRPPMLKSMDEGMHEKMTQLLTEISRLKNARQYFNVPVDYVKLKLPTYLDIIKEPMDLGTVKAKLEADRSRDYDDKNYQFAEEFAHDVRLVFKNAFVFNLPSHVVFKGAKQLADIFEEKLAALYKQAEMVGPPCPLKVRCQLLLSDMRRNPFSEWYRKDDWRKFGPAYTAALSSGTPMDLNQVQQRLAEGEYERASSDGETVDFSVDAFARDMRLVWDNAMEFNSGADYTKVFWLCAKLLSDTFSKRLELLKAAPTPGERGKRKEPREGWPTFDQKRDLARKCARLPEHVGNEVALAVQQGCADAVAVEETHGVQQAVVDLDKVDAATFKHAEEVLKRGHR